MRVCGVADDIGTGGMCRWPDGNIGVNVLKVLPGCTPELYEQNVLSVYSHIARHCGIKPFMARQARDARVTLTVAAFDGPSGVLADSRLPCGNTTVCPQRYDHSEKWHFGLDRPDKGSIWFWMVLLHETLHALGLPHAPSGVKCVIAPMYDPSLDGLMAYDIQELVKRYGPPNTVPSLPPTTPGGNMGGLKNLIDILAQIKPLLDLWSDPAFQDLLKKIIAIFGNKAALTADDVETLQIELGSQVQQMRAP